MHRMLLVVRNISLVVRIVNFKKGLPQKVRGRP